MSTTDYVVDILLIVVIFRQLRSQEYTLRNAVLPIGIMAWAGAHYLKGFHVGGNDVALIAIFTLLGAALGAASGMATFMWRTDDGRVFGKVGLWACVFWIAGMGFRFLFAVYANTASGDRHIGNFSVAHHITSGQAWTTALVFMAFAEVALRVVLLQVRRARLAAEQGRSIDLTSGAIDTAPTQPRVAGDVPGQRQAVADQADRLLD